MALAPGDRLGPYEIQSALGAGGMGEVFRAKDTRLDRTVAIKILAPGSSFAMTAVPRSLFPLQRQAGYPLIVNPVDGRFLLLDRPDADIPQIIVTQNAFNQSKP